MISILSTIFNRRMNRWRTEPVIALTLFIISVKFILFGVDVDVDAFILPLSPTQIQVPHSSSKLFSTTGGMSTSPSVTSLLDGEQEQVIVNRANVEENILAQSSSPRDELLMATETERKEATKWIKKVIKDESRMETRKSGGGFGGSSGGGTAAAKKKKKGNTKKNTKTKLRNNADSETPTYNSFSWKLDESGHGAILQKNGVARINNVLAPSTAQTLLNYVDAEKERSEDEVSSGKVPQLSRFTRVLLKSNRCDLLLPFDEENDAIMQALYELLGDGSSKNLGTVGSVIESTLSPNAELYEFACLISDPGSDRQVIHPDIAHQGDKQKRTGPLITCFIALQDIDSEMGPSEFLPRTNTAEFHRQLNDHSLRDDMLGNVASKISLLKEGDCSIFDATTLHAGTANKSEHRRRLFYFTFRSLAMEDPRTWNNPGSIRPEVKDRKLSLKDIQDAIQRWRKTEQQQL